MAHPVYRLADLPVVDRVNITFFQGSQVRYFDFDQNRLWGAMSLWGSTRGLFVLLYDEIKIMKTH